MVNVGFLVEAAGNPDVVNAFYQAAGIGRGGKN
jgi:hypothetical protein